MTIKDKNFRRTNSNRHPFAEPYMAFSDKPGTPTIYFESKYEDTHFCRKHWGIAPADLVKLDPTLYYWPEKKEHKRIILKNGGHVRIPHGFYLVHTVNGEPATYNVRSEDQL